MSAGEIIEPARLCSWEFGRAHFTGSPYARCCQCGATVVYWDDIEELQQVCSYVEPEYTDIY